MMKKIISLILCIVLLGISAAGCAKGENSNDSGKEAFEYKITLDSHYSDMDESTVNTYKKLCEAVIAYERDVNFNTAIIDDINTLFYTSFPFYTLVDNIRIKPDNSGVIISYSYTAQEHKEKIDAFNSAVKKIMTECGYGKVSKNAYVLNVYSYLCRHIETDYSVTSVLDAAISGKGMNASISGLFECLLLQSDISASHILVMDNGSISDIISMAQFNGNNYYFDIASEIEETGGDGLAFFAMDSKRAADKDAVFNYTDGTQAQELTDKAYKNLADCISYELDGNTVTADCGRPDKFTFELD